MQVPICGGGQNPYLVTLSKNPESIVRMAAQEALIRASLDVFVQQEINRLRPSIMNGIMECTSARIAIIRTCP